MKEKEQQLRLRLELTAPSAGQQLNWFQFRMELFANSGPKWNETKPPQAKAEAEADLVDKVEHS